MEKIKFLLNSISPIIESDKKIQNERNARGENFNIFTIVGLYKEEVKFHSGIITALLNPEGTHGRGDVFLREFIEIVGIKDLCIDTQNTKINKELSIGSVTETTGGRIDIILRAGKKAIIIENKIFAKDQVNQLLRYHNFAEKENYEFRLLYLNLNDEYPDESSFGGIEYNDNFKIITYKNHIKLWLERCIELSARQPLVRETLIQYLGIINHLTKQNMDETKKQEVIKLLSNNLVPAEQIFTYFSIAKDAIQKQVKESVCEILRAKIGDRFIIKNFNNYKYSIIWIKYKNKKMPEKIFFGVQSFVENSCLIVGVFDNKRDTTLIGEDVFPENESFSKWWINIRTITDGDNNCINLGNMSYLEKLHKDSNYQEKIINHISNEIIDYVNRKSPELISFFKAE